MESKYPICNPSEADFDAAIADYITMFGAPPPGSGRSPARYQAAVLAIEVGKPATEKDVQDFRVDGGSCG